MKSAFDAPRFQCSRITPAIMAIALWFLSTAPARAQCSRWLPGPLQSNSADVNGAILCSTTWDPDGGGPLQELLVVGGDFTRIGGIDANRIASWDGAVWRPLGTGMNSTVRALISWSGLLLAGGDFTTAGDGATNWVSRWNGYNWLSLSNGLYSGTGVHCFAIHSGQLYCGGDYYHYTRRWDGPSSTWVSFAESVNGPVYAMASFNGSLHAGGAFTQAGFNTRNRVARWSGSAWQDMAGGLPGDVYTMTTWNGSLYVGGRFAWDAGNGYQRNAIEWTGSSWQIIDCGAVCELNGNVRGMTVYNNELYASGDFIGAASHLPRRVARFLDTGWGALGTGIGPFSANGEVVQALAVYNGELIALGRFTTPTSNIARWNGSAWQEYSSPVTVNALAAFGSRVAFGGSFSQYFPTGTSYHVVAWNGSQLQSLTTGTNAPVRALTGYTDTSNPPKDRLVVGGDFSVAGGIAANRVALYTISDNVFTTGWSIMGDGFNGTVRALTRFYGLTVAAGDFTASGANARNRVARWDGSAWQNLGTGMNGPVHALKAYTSGPTTFKLVAGGSFTTANGVAASNIAVWTASTVVPETPWLALGSGLTGTVHSIEYHGGSLYAGGYITASGATPLTNIARFVPATGWVSVGAGLTGIVHALRLTGGYLYAAGTFPGGVARWNGTTWSVVDGNSNDAVFALAPWQSEILAGGQFTSMRSGALLTRAAARYTDTGLPWFSTQPTTQTVDQGETVTLRAYTAEGYTGLSYAWRRNGAPLTGGATGNGSTLWGANSYALTIEGIAPADSGSYDCVASSGCGSMTSQAAQITVNSVSGVGETGPAALTALAIGPNPFHSSTRIGLTLASPGMVRAEVFDLSGRRVRRLHDGELSDPGPFLDWDGRDDSGRDLPAGSYFVRVIAGNAKLSRRIVLLR